MKKGSNTFFIIKALGEASLCLGDVHDKAEQDTDIVSFLKLCLDIPFNREIKI